MKRSRSRERLFFLLNHWQQWIAAARKQKAAAEKEIDAMLDLEVPNEWLDPAVEIYEAAKWE